MLTEFWTIFVIGKWGRFKCRGVVSVQLRKHNDSASDPHDWVLSELHLSHCVLSATVGAEFGPRGVVWSVVEHGDEDRIGERHYGRGPFAARHFRRLGCSHHRHSAPHGGSFCVLARAASSLVNYLPITNPQPINDLSVLFQGWVPEQVLPRRWTSVCSVFVQAYCRKSFGRLKSVLAKWNPHDQSVNRGACLFRNPCISRQNVLLCHIFYSYKLHRVNCVIVVETVCRMFELYHCSSFNLHHLESSMSDL